MLALNKTAAGLGNVSLQEIDVRRPSAGEMLVKVKASGLCGTDMSVYKGAGAYAQRMSYPTTLGHEAVGEVVELGDVQSNFKVGDLVSLESHIPCRICLTCKSGNTHICPNTKYPGIDINGTFAEFATVPTCIAWVNPPGISIEQAALLEPLGIAVNATLEGKGVAGRTVLINGCGPIGLMNISVAKHFGAAKVFAIDHNLHRLKVATEMGADVTLDPAKVNVAQAVKEMTANEGIDVVFEYTGSVEGARNAFAFIAVGGELKWCATPNQAFEFDFGLWRKSRPTIYNIHGRKIWSTWHVASNLVHAQKISLNPIISHRLPLSDAVRAFDLVMAGEAIKPLLILE
ncbi:alcohol dehydrogenase catalytic domain-containing protein [Pseudomonas putida]|uniref:alcohol dehydrogenase catalytic domain-containing protein n=1 Tax=Pseudomonas putida TaxID=303 RepID=UPI002270BCB2|nr:alcohol dehydrogenase catalytic domain-containing protein [Pseudomonas putida]WAB99752.1 alcohol dehydrogenase catalytic domain-containing protein [Pseudomonas putida]